MSIGSRNKLCSLHLLPLLKRNLYLSLFSLFLVPVLKLLQRASTLRTPQFRHNLRVLCALELNGPVMLSHQRCARWGITCGISCLCWWTKVKHCLHLSLQGRHTGTLVHRQNADIGIQQMHQNHSQTTGAAEVFSAECESTFYFICMGLENSTFKFLNGMAVLRFVHCSAPWPFQSMNPNQGCRSFGNLSHSSLSLPTLLLDDTQWL